MYSTLKAVKNSTGPIRNNIPGPNRQRPIVYAESVFNNRTSERSNFAPRQSTTSKSLWGRPLWFSLHYGALNYPDNPTDEIRNMMVGFILGLPVMIPCDECKNHAYNYIQGKKSQLYDITENKELLFRFWWEFHNHVNNKSGKQQISLAEAYDLYSNTPHHAY